MLLLSEVRPETLFCVMFESQCPTWQSKPAKITLSRRCISESHVKASYRYRDCIMGKGRSINMPKKSKQSIWFNRILFYLFFLSFLWNIVYYDGWLDYCHVIGCYFKRYHNIIFVHWWYHCYRHLWTWRDRTIFILYIDKDIWVTIYRQEPRC